MINFENALRGIFYLQIFLLTINCISAIIQLKEVYYSHNTLCNRVKYRIIGILEKIVFRKRKESIRMISFENFIMADGSPIYLQILLYLKRGIIAGSICDGDELPSRRVLSALLGVNPNTVQKAYKMLEDEGLIASRTGAKSYVVVTEAKLKEIRGELLEADAMEAVAKLKQMGVSKEEAHALIDRFWDSSKEA